MCKQIKKEPNTQNHEKNKQIVDNILENLDENKSIDSKNKDRKLNINSESNEENIINDEDLKNEQDNIE